MASPGSVVIQFKAVTDKARANIVNFAKALGDVDDSAADTDRALARVDDAIDDVAASARSADSDLGRAQTGIDQIGNAARDAATDIATIDRELDTVDFDRVAVDAELAARKVRAAAQDMASGVRTGAQDIDAETGHIRQNMADTGKEAGAEFIGNIAEGIGSGQANLNDVVSGTLGGITNLAATLAGPFGLAAAGAAAGVGLVFSAVKGQAEATNSRVLELIGSLEEVGRTSGKTARAVVWDTWLAKMQENRGLLSDIVGELQSAGIKGTTFRDAIGGSAEAQEQVRDRLRETAHELLVAQGNGKKLTSEQQRYLDNYGLILKELDTMNGDLASAQGYFDDVSYLSGKAGEEMGEWDGKIDKAKTSAEQLNKKLDKAAQDRTISIHFDIDKWKAGDLGGAWAVSGGGNSRSAGPSLSLMAAPTAATTPAPAPPTVIVTEEQVYRAVQRLLLRGQARNGRVVMVG